jgi:hypothetical protein
MANSLKTLIADGYEAGKFSYSGFRRVFPFVSTAGTWVDMSMATGGPSPNYYFGDDLTATVPTDWYKKGIWHGTAVTPDKKYLHKIAMFCATANAAPAPYLLCDYLMYYPVIDMDSTDELFFINFHAVNYPLVPTLPRYTDGIGVKMFVVATNPFIGDQTFQIKYTNTLDQARISKPCVSNVGSNIATILNSYAVLAADGKRWGPFVELQQGDLGIKSVQSIQFMGSNGGLACVVLVKPIATLMLKGVDAWAEVDFIKDKNELPRIYDGAYLNLLAMPAGSIAAAVVTGEITTIWGG